MPHPTKLQGWLWKLFNGTKYRLVYTNKGFVSTIYLKYFRHIRTHNILQIILEWIWQVEILKELKKEKAPSKPIIVNLESLQSASHNCRIDWVVEFRSEIPNHQLFFQKTLTLYTADLTYIFEKPLRNPLMVIIWINISWNKYG